MAITCTICRHSKLNEINAALIASEPHRSVAKRFSVSAPAVFRHKSEHLGTYLAKAKEFQDSNSASDLVRRLREIHVETAAILAHAKKAKDWATALRAITRLEAQIELEAELLGQLEHGGRGGETHVVVQYVDKMLVTTPGQVPAPARLPAPVNEKSYQKA
jgi:hypothetical protein